MTWLMVRAHRHAVLALIAGLCALTTHAIPSCTKVDDCSCKTPDGKAINIRSLGNRDGKTPRFGYETAAGELWMYAYNPCYAFTDENDCSNVVACQKDDNEMYGIGDASAFWSDDGTHYTIEYSHMDSVSTTRTSVVTLVCDESQEAPRLDRHGSGGLGTTYLFTLTSKCACPGGCDSSTPTVKPHGPGGISPGSVLCIIVSLLIIFYAVGGVLFMKFARQAEGAELIPNYNMWTSLFCYTRDGILFVFSCGKKTGYNTMT